MRIIYCDLLQLIEKLSFCFCCCCCFEHTKTFDLPYTVGGICTLFCVSSHYKTKKKEIHSQGLGSPIKATQGNKESRGGVSQVKNSVNFDWSRLSYWSTSKKSGLVVLTLGIPADVKTLDTLAIWHRRLWLLFFCFWVSLDWTPASAENTTTSITVWSGQMHSPTARITMMTCPL